MPLSSSAARGGPAPDARRSQGGGPFAPLDSPGGASVVPSSPSKPESDRQITPDLEGPALAERLEDVMQERNKQRHSVVTKLINDLEAGKGVKLMQLSAEHWLVDHVVFKSIVMFLVIFNAIQMGFEVDYPELDHIWKVFDHVYGAAFFIEMLIKLAAIRVDYFRDRWNWLDGTLAVMGFMDTWFITLIGGADSTGLSNFSVLRILRLLRLVRLLRLFRQFTKLVVVMQSILDAIETTFWVASILLVCIYVCAIFCVQMMGKDDGTYPAYATDTPTIDESETMGNFNPYICFGSMSAAMLSLMNIAILAEWAEIVRPVYLKQPPLVLFFVGFVVFVCFGVMNVIIGMIVDSVMSNARTLELELDESLRKEKVEVIKRLKELVFRMDANGDCTLDIDELHALLHGCDPQIREVMAKVELPYGCSAEELLDLLDKNGNGHLEHDEFLQSFYRLIDCGGFQQMCLMQMGVNKITRGMSTNHELLKNITQQLEQQSSKIETLWAQAGQASDASIATIADTTSSPPPSTQRPELAKRLDTICQEVTKAVHSNLRKELTQCFENVPITGQWEVIDDKLLVKAVPPAQQAAYPFNAPMSDADASTAMQRKEVDSKPSQRIAPDSATNNMVGRGEAMGSSFGRQDALPPHTRLRVESVGADSSASSHFPETKLEKRDSVYIA